MGAGVPHRQGAKIRRARNRAVEIRKLGRYEIVSQLGKGAMGVVYKAADPLLGRIVAVKTINLSLAEEGELAEYEARFYQEAKAAGGLNHPNIVTVHDIGKSDEFAFMAMEFLEGRELRELLAVGKPLEVDQALDIAAQVADGLAYAHEHHVIHRDIKPANIMIVRGGLAKITDFGIARMRSSDVRTATGVVFGSPKYMSPEQVMGKRADQRSDVFSLGVVLHEMLTGATPFNGDSVSTVMFQTLNLIPGAPSLANPGVPQMLDYIVAKALAKSLDARYQNARELADDLRVCRRQLHAGPADSAAPARPLESVPEALVQTLVDAEAKAGLAGYPSPKSRRTDEGEAQDSPTLGISKSFDSLEATMRLAAATGMTGELDAYVETQKLPQPQRIVPGAAELKPLTPPQPVATAGSGSGRRAALAQPEASAAGAREHVTFTLILIALVTLLAAAMIIIY
ncbi:MAG: serine/threonine protein kinase [Betaproteobacteria bacterium]|nr:serine/threonine protein kinase [Betaproteobacteria bacterium]